MAQNTGSPAGNPGYSFASKWSFMQWITTGNGYYTLTVWVGSKGGDTPGHRKQFEDWLRIHTIVDPKKIRYK